MSANGDAAHFEAPLVVVTDGSGEGLIRERKANRNAVARRQYFRGVSGPDRDHLHIFATRELNE